MIWSPTVSWMMPCSVSQLLPAAQMKGRRWPVQPHSSRQSRAWQQNILSSFTSGASSEASEALLGTMLAAGPPCILALMRCAVSPRLCSCTSRAPFSAVQDLHSRQRRAYDVPSAAHSGCAEAALEFLSAAHDLHLDLPSLTAAEHQSPRLCSCAPEALFSKKQPRTYQVSLCLGPRGQSSLKYWDGLHIEALWEPSA